MTEENQTTALQIATQTEGTRRRMCFRIVSFSRGVNHEVHIARGQKLNTNFFLKLFEHHRDIPAKSRDIPPKKFDFPGFEGHTELFGPHPFTWKTPTPPGNIRTQKLGLCSFFVPELRWPGDSQRESGRFARTDSRESICRKTPIFITCERFAQIASKLRFSICSPPKRDSRKKGVQFGNPETIRENQAMRANLRIDSRESGHLST